MTLVGLRAGIRLLKANVYLVSRLTGLSDGCWGRAAIGTDVERSVFTSRVSESGRLQGGTSDHFSIDPPGGYPTPHRFALCADPRAGWARRGGSHCHYHGPGHTGRALQLPP